MARFFRSLAVCGFVVALFGSIAANAADKEPDKQPAGGQTIDLRGLGTSRGVLKQPAADAPSGASKIAEKESPMPTTRGVQVPDGGTVLLGGVPVSPGAAVAGWRKSTLEWDDGIIVGKTQLNAAGEFEFKNLKAGSYRLVPISPTGSNAPITKVGPGQLVLPTDSLTAKGSASTGNTPLDTGSRRTTIGDGAQLQQTFTITVTAVNDAPSVSNTAPGGVTAGQGNGTLRLLVGTDGGLWIDRSQQVITVGAGGTLHGTVQTAESINERRTRAPNVTELFNGELIRVSTESGSTSAVYGSDAIAGVVNFKKMAAGPTLTNINGTNTLLLGVTTAVPAGGGGLSITSVADGGLAQRMGLQQRDLLRAVNGNQLNTHDDLVAQLQVAAKKLEAAADAKTPNGLPLDLLSFALVRGGKYQTVALAGRNNAWYVNDDGGGSTRGTVWPGGKSNGEGIPEDEGWRMKLHNNEYWYYGKDNQWKVFRGGKWVDAPSTALPAPVAAGDINGDGKVNLPRAGAAITGRVLGTIGGANGNGKADTNTATPGGAVPGGGFIPALPGRKTPAGGKSPSPAGGLRGAFGS